MRTAVTLSLLLTLIAISGASNAEEHESIHPLIGVWRVVAMEHEGRADSGVSFKGMQYSFDNKTWTTRPGDSTPAGMADRPSLKLTYTVDDSIEPKRLTGTIVHKMQTRTLKAIYKFDSDKLVLCFGAGAWPADFDTSHSKTIRYTAERIPQSSADNHTGG
ncbi:hypothetical protein CA13_65520 [Planctomycetes bacterium CA13]|uniref:TIGR03067 domain-containing protein n=1 Tax=Novipirellula herctigrandis TaxID=2527986 RepID=A0A5C5ZD35_9BACT|nr:hypothetical protein CA13_65520 [Planctomycetes bacterium CA13]